MIIHQPESIKIDGYTVVWSRLESSQAYEDFPDYLWYRVPEEYSRYLSTQSDAFLLPVLYAAMHFGEKLDVRGVVSPRLAYNLDEYQFLQSSHFPKHIKPIPLQFDKLKRSDAMPEGIATGFSGGVDLWHTIQNHLNDQQPNPEYQLTHAVFINGFDILQSDRKKYEHLFTQYKSFLLKLDIELIPVETNVIRAILPYLEYRVFYAPVLFGPVLILDKLLKRFIATNSRNYFQPQVTSAPLPDRLLSTETLEITHFGATFRREEKIESLTHWSFVWDKLRVCGTPNMNVLNCSSCEKCVRTMLPLHALGKMDLFTTFANPLKSNYDSLRLARKFDPYSDHVPLNVEFFNKKKPELLPWLFAASILGSVRFWFLKLLPVFIKSWLKRYGYFIDKLKQENAFENPTIIELIRSKKYIDGET